MSEAESSSENGISKCYESPREEKKARFIGKVDLGYIFHEGKVSQAVGIKRLCQAWLSKR